jgi:ABC-2 type transport system ATP-binding protein/sodium transport system ATP-binding protein
LCNRFGLMHEGRLRLEGTLDDLQRQTGCASLVEIFTRHVRSSPAA